MRTPGFIAVSILVLVAVGVGGFYLQSRPSSQDSAAARAGGGPDAVVSEAGEGAGGEEVASDHANQSAVHRIRDADRSGVDATSGATQSGERIAGTAVEPSLLSGHALSASASDLANSPAFDEQLRALRAQSDAGRLQRQRDYESLLADHVAKGLKGVALHEVACGAVVCMASLDVEPGASGWKGWLSSLQGNGVLPMPALSSGTYEAPNGSKSVRMIFTTDPAYAAIMGAAPRP